MKNWEKFTSITSIIVAIAALIVAVNAMKVSYQTNLPVIYAISTIRCDETEGLCTEEIIVSNDGFPLRDFDCDADVYMRIWVYASEVTYIPIYGYFGIMGDYTGNRKGLLVSMSEKDNYSLYSSIERDFRQEMSKDGYSALVSLYTILSVSYEDYTRASWREYYSVDRTGAHEMSEDYARTILNSASANRELMESEGLDCYISSFNGTALWHWFKGQYLE